MAKKPIMTADEEKFMAFEGLVQWAQAVVSQSKRVANRRDEILRNADSRRMAVLSSQCEYHFFSIAAHKVIEHRDWTLALGLCANIDFSEINAFSAKDIRDLRNMREHIVDYFKGEGRDTSRWMVETPEYKADASSLVGTMIGGRLDWVAFTSATERLLSKLLSEPGRISTQIRCSELREPKTLLGRVSWIENAICILTYRNDIRGESFFRAEPRPTLPPRVVKMLW